MRRVLFTSCALLATKSCAALPAAAPATRVPSVTLNQGGQLPLVSLGTGSGQHSDVVAATALWIANGGSAIDTAHDYGDEGDIAKGIAQSGVAPSSIFLTTKITCGTYKKAAKQIDDNLSQLGAATVNLTLIHFDRCFMGGSLSETWRALEDAKTAGKTIAIGALCICRRLTLIASLPHSNTLQPRLLTVRPSHSIALQPHRLTASIHRLLPLSP